MSCNVDRRPVEGDKTPCTSQHRDADTDGTYKAITVDRSDESTTYLHCYDDLEQNDCV